MLPSRGIAKANPAFVLRQSLASRTQVGAVIDPFQTRSYSRASLATLSSRSVPRPSLVGHGKQSPSIRIASYAPWGAAAAGVFAQRAGASRNLSVWPSSSSNTPKSPSSEQPISSTQTPSSPSLSPSGNDAWASASTPDLSSHNASIPNIDPDSFSVLDMPERIGYLKELGLEFGFGPTAMCEWALEHIYIYTGLPWWATIATLAAAYRVIMFKPTMTATKHQSRLALLQKNPEYAKVKAEFDQSMFQTKDKTRMLLTRQKLSAMTKEAGANPFYSFIHFLTIPFSFGTFRILRSMSSIPVPTLETGGILWFTDLTTHDPYYILPLVNVVIGVAVMRSMGNANATMNPLMQNMQKMMLYVFPPIMFLGMAWIPAAVQWFFMCLSLGTLVQTRASMNPAVRRFFELPPLPTPNLPVGGAQYSPPSPSIFGSMKKDAGILGPIKKDAAALRQSWDQQFSGGDKGIIATKAREYEEHRAEEERRIRVLRMEEERRRRAERRGRQ
ncbi:hypothetical protein F4780DRAFT_772471 [Xylariomycetidae sp. FL0641]|nr:hypothetical protein F4780DRAFT_772471 [Xylariomycetidae sp. FL0641]